LKRRARTMSEMLRQKLVEIGQGMIDAWQGPDDVRAERDRLKAEVARLRKALLWYEEKAKKATVSYPHWEDAYGEIVDDGGRRARKALEGKDDV